MSGSVRWFHRIYRSRKMRASLILLIFTGIAGCARQDGQPAQGNVHQERSGDFATQPPTGPETADTVDHQVVAEDIPAAESGSGDSPSESPDSDSDLRPPISSNSSMPGSERGPESIPGSEESPAAPPESEFMAESEAEPAAEKKQSETPRIAKDSPPRKRASPSPSPEPPKAVPAGSVPPGAPQMSADGDFADQPSVSTAAGGDSGGGDDVVIRRPGSRSERHGYSVERVYFATNRRPDDSPRASADPDYFFGSESGPLRYGVCEVSMPYRRQPGTLPEPSLLHLEFHQDPARHVVLMQINLLGETGFRSQLQASVNASEEKQLLIFIHGYSASFRDAARRTAQIAYDMNYQGPSLFFSWPAGSSSEGLNRWNYVNDLRRADESREDLVSFLSSVAASSGATRIHLVAHSMGNHLLTESLKIMADRYSGAPQGQRIFEGLAMAAPDVNAKEFVERTARRIRPFSGRFTVYASSNDKALRFSQKLNGWDPLGLINQYSVKLAKAESFELIDASAVSAGWFDTGHIYYGDMPEVIRDFNDFFHGKPAGSRSLKSVPPVFRLVQHNQ